MKRDPLAALELRYKKKQYAEALKVLRGKKTEPLAFARALAKAKKLQRSLGPKGKATKKRGKR